MKEIFKFFFKSNKENIEKILEKSIKEKIIIIIFNILLWYFFLVLTIFLSKIDNNDIFWFSLYYILIFVYPIILSFILKIFRNKNAIINTFFSFSIVTNLFFSTIFIIYILNNFLTPFIFSYNNYYLNNIYILILFFFLIFIYFKNFYLFFVLIKNNFKSIFKTFFAIFISFIIYFIFIGVLYELNKPELIWI